MGGQRGRGGQSGAGEGKAPRPAWSGVPFRVGVDGVGTPSVQQLPLPCQQGHRCGAGWGWSASGRQRPAWRACVAASQCSPRLSNPSSKMSSPPCPSPPAAAVDRTYLHPGQERQGAGCGWAAGRREQQQPSGGRQQPARPGWRWAAAASAALPPPELQLLGPRVVHLALWGVAQHLKGRPHAGKGGWVATLVGVVLLGQLEIGLRDRGRVGRAENECGWAGSRLGKARVGVFTSRQRWRRRCRRRLLPLLSPS